MTEKDDIEYGFCTGFFGDGYATHKFHSGEDDKWDHEWDFEKTSQHAREAAWPGETFEGFVSNCGDVVTIHIKESSSIPIDSIKKWFGLDKEHGVETVLVEKFNDWK